MNVITVDKIKLFKNSQKPFTAITAYDYSSAKIIDAADVMGDNKIVKISVVGVGMRSHAGVARTIFKALADEKINIQMISTSEIKVSVVVDEKHLESGVRILHMAFGLGKE